MPEYFVTYAAETLHTLRKKIGWEGTEWLCGRTDGGSSGEAQSGDVPQKEQRLAVLRGVSGAEWGNAKNINCCSW